VNTPAAEETGSAVQDLPVTLAHLAANPGLSSALFPPRVSWLRPLRKVSPVYQYISHDPLRQGISLVAVGVAVGTVAVLVAAAVGGFRRRDVAG
jgi:hypothetical protein